MKLLLWLKASSSKHLSFLREQDWQQLDNWVGTGWKTTRSKPCFCIATITPFLLIGELGETVFQDVPPIGLELST